MVVFGSGYSARRASGDVAMVFTVISGDTLLVGVLESDANFEESLV